jgi:glycosyltransferase involved in cell wall biosynthesis
MLMNYISPSILTFIPFPYYGGLQEFAIKLACRLHTPTLVIGDKHALPNDVMEELRVHGIDIYWVQQELSVFRNPLIANPRIYYKVVRLLKGYDIIHFHGPFPLVGDVVLSSNVRFIFTYHYDIELRDTILNSIARVYSYFLLSKTLRKAKIVTASSKYFIEESPYLKSFLHKVKDLPLGVDTSLLSPTFKYDPQIVFIGRIIPEKGIDVLIKAFELLSRSNSELRLFVIGKPVDIKYWSYLRQYVWRKNLRGKVIFTGYLPKDKLVGKLTNSSALVLPSLTRLDSFGIVLLEANSLAIPVVSSNIVPGARELVEKARSGISVPPGNHYALAEAIEKVLENPKEYGVRGREYVVRNHDWSVVMEKARQIYRLALQT